MEGTRLRNKSADSAARNAFRRPVWNPTVIAFAACALLAACAPRSPFDDEGDETLGSHDQGLRSEDQRTYSSIGISQAHVCALVGLTSNAGKVKCWGLGSSGQLGNGSSQNQLTPTLVSGITTAIGVSVGAFHSCAVRSNGRVSCWGRGLDGQLGNAANTNALTPVTVLTSGGFELNNAVQIDLGADHSCAVTAAGNVACWGRNTNGQLGDGTTTPRNSAVYVNGITTAISIAVGAYHSCAVLADGTARCWGLNALG
ncbi:MAG: hypothetical protein HY908_37120, partial [Myxococcales bacterium]|nr:hypothetical protein [Myxococcales bacterium]